MDGFKLIGVVLRHLEERMDALETLMSLHVRWHTEEQASEMQAALTDIQRTLKELQQSLSQQEASMQWFDVDDTGHVPGVAAELPRGYQVLLDGQGYISDMRPIAGYVEPAPEPVTTAQPPESMPAQEQASVDT